MGEEGQGRCRTEEMKDRGEVGQGRDRTGER